MEVPTTIGEAYTQAVLPIKNSGLLDRSPDTDKLLKAIFFQGAMAGTMLGRKCMEELLTFCLDELREAIKAGCASA